MPPEVFRNHILALKLVGNVRPLDADELDGLSWRAKAMRAALLDLPTPIRPGLWGKVKVIALRLYSMWLDRKAFAQEISRQALRICILEDLLEHNGVEIPGGRES